MKLGFAGASRSFVWFTFHHYEVSPLWFLEPACEPYERIGDCSIPRECPRVTPDQVPNPTPSLYPGEITVAEVPLVFDPLSESLGSSRSFEPVLPEGEPIRFSVAGSPDVPAHGGEFVIPALVTVTEPDFSTPIVVDRSVPFRMKWIPTSGGVVIIGLSEEFGPGSIGCSASTTAGEIEMLPEALSTLPASTEANPATLSIAVRETITFAPDDWKVRLVTEGSTRSVSATIH